MGCSHSSRAVSRMNASIVLTVVKCMNNGKRLNWEEQLLHMPETSPANENLPLFWISLVETVIRTKQVYSFLSQTVVSDELNGHYFIKRKQILSDYDEMFQLFMICKIIFSKNEQKHEASGKSKFSVLTSSTKLCCSPLRSKSKQMRQFFNNLCMHLCMYFQCFREGNVYFKMWIF